jgi:hypothetical protein
MISTGFAKPLRRSLKTTWPALGGPWVELEKLWAAVARRHGRRRAGAARIKVPSSDGVGYARASALFNAGAYPSFGY